jgi:hypothetical protein
MNGTSETAEPESFVPLLDAIRDILLRHDYLAQATWVADLIDLAHLQSSNFARELGGGEMWGSAGSVADVVGLRHSLDPVDAEAERDSLELRRPDPVGRADEGARDLVGGVRICSELFSPRPGEAALVSTWPTSGSQPRPRSSAGPDQATKQSRRALVGGRWRSLGRRVTEDRGDDGPGLGQAVTVHE